MMVQSSFEVESQDEVNEVIAGNLVACAKNQKKQIQNR
ncbi:hypothetical protein STRDD13_00129 [Streptococcus sp. DD13]|nr:hypothetical protein STRDD13_00129 [Streptococcus sp. DD13]